MENEKVFLEPKEVVLEAEYRSLPPLERTAELVINHVASLQSAADACHVSKSSVFRAVHAIEEGRPVGKNGNHYIFDAEHEVELAALIKARSEKEALDFHMVHNMVKTLII